MALPIVAIGGVVVDGIKSWFGHKKAKTEAKREVELATIKAGDSADTAAAGGMSTSWKDEFLTVVFTIPMGVIFYAAVWGDPADIERVKDAFAAMQELPEWYMWSILGIVIGTFGLRGLAKLVPGAK